MLEYHRNVNFMTNIIHNLSQTNRIPNYYTYESPRRMERSQNDAYNDLLSIYFSNQLQRNANTREGQGLSQQEITRYTEMVVYDSSMNEQICPITHIEFEEGEEVCKISSCGQSAPQTPQTLFDADFEGLASNAELYIFNQEDSQE